MNSTEDRRKDGSIYLPYSRYTHGELVVAPLPSSQSTSTVVKKPPVGTHFDDMTAYFWT